MATTTKTTKTRLPDHTPGVLARGVRLRQCETHIGLFYYTTRGRRGCPLCRRLSHVTPATRTW
jgi:hypothetical protein